MSARQTSRAQIIGAIIGFFGLVVAALIGIYPSACNRKAQIAIAGIVVDEGTNHGIGQARIVVTGRTEEYVTEDSGKFRIGLPPDTPKRVRLHVTKPGFQPRDTSVEPPAENLVLQLRKE